MEDAPFVSCRRDHLPPSFCVGHDVYVGNFVLVYLADGGVIHFGLLRH